MFFQRVAVLWLCCFAVSCQLQSAPDLLSVERVHPAQLRQGDRLLIDGRGLPAGKIASVTLTGEVVRAGSSKRVSVLVSAPARSSAGDQVSMVLDDAMSTQLCGTADDARHSTFRGNIRLAFAPKLRGAPPIVGTLRGVVLDFFPSGVTDSVRAQRRRLGIQGLEALGIGFGPAGNAGTSGERMVRPVVSVRAGSSAQRGGIIVGDRLTGFHGLNLYTLSDLSLPPGQDLLPIEVQRAGVPGVVAVTLDARGLAPLAAGDAAPWQALLLIAALAFGFVMSPLFAMSRWLELSLGARLAAWRRYGATAASRVGHGPLIDSSRTRGRSGSRAIRYALLLLVLGVFAAAAGGTRMLGIEYAPITLYLISSISFATIGLIAGGAQGLGWSLRRGMASTLSIAVLDLPLVVMIATAAISTGSFRVEDWATAQGLYPWQWKLFASPTCLLMLLAAVPAWFVGEPGTLAYRQAVVSRRPGSRRLGSWFEASAWYFHFVEVIWLYLFTCIYW